MSKIRTLDEIQHRICFRQERLDRMMADPNFKDDAKAIVRKFEEDILHTLKQQIINRVVWYFKCTGVIA